MKNSIILRSLLFIAGLFIMAIGIDLSVKANLGVSPISSVPYVYDLKYPLTLGQTTIILNALLIFLQMLILQKDYQWFQLVQFPIVFLFGMFIDLAMPLLSWVEPTHYISQVLYCLLSCFILGLGVFIEVKSELTYLPGEGLAMALTRRFNIEFGKAKIGTDSSLVVIGVISSFALLGNIQGIREGTLVSALTVGYIVRFFDKVIPIPKQWLSVQPKVIEPTLQEVIKPSIAPDTKGIVITISRELGSGGHEIGQRVASKLGFSFYDENLIQLTAGKSGFTPEYIKNNEQQLAHSLLFALYEQNYAYVKEQMPPLEALFMVQSKIIREIGSKGSCVIIGRCADFVLKDHPTCFNVFIYGDDDFRLKRVFKKYEVNTAEARKKIENSDKKRTNYYMHYTGKEWGKNG